MKALIRTRPFRRFCAGAAFFAVVLAACGKAPATPEENLTLRLGYFPNVTHATALVGSAKGIIAANLGSKARLELKTFSAGPAAVEALFSDALDAAYTGPNPAINAFARSEGKAVRIISGATSGGAFLVVKPAVNSAAGLKGRKLASPQLGSTQDVALRAWLLSQGLKTDDQGGGDVSVIPQDNAQTLETFKAGVINGAWVPEPWATRLVIEGGGKVLVDERDLWPGGKYVTTHLIVRTAFLKQHPGAVEALLKSQIEANDFVNSHPAESQRLVNDAIAAITGKKLPGPVVTGAWGNLAFTNDPIASSLRKSATQAESLGLLPKIDLEGIYDLSILNRLLRATGRAEVSS